jgi:hypothetical protein
MTTSQEIQISRIGDIQGNLERIDEMAKMEFLRLPWHIYDKDPVSKKNWVPPNLKEMQFVLSMENPFFEHAHASLFLAKREGNAVGRIAAIVDDSHNQVHAEQTGFFGYYESQDDLSVSLALFLAAEDLLRNEQMDVIRGPMNPSMNDECGLLVDGFDSPPQIMMPYTPAYYMKHLDLNGFHPVKTLLSYVLTPDVIAANPKVRRLAQFPQKKGFITRSIRLNDLEAELAKFKEIYNDAWTQNWGFVPMTEKEIDSMAKRMADLIDPKYILLVEKELDGVEPEPIAVLLCVPNYNIALKHMDGKDGLKEKIQFIKYGGFPANLLNGALRRIYSGTIREARLMVMGVKREYRGGAYVASLLQELQKNIGPDFTIDMSWTLEDNVRVNSVIEGLGGKVYKRHKIYEKKL